MTTKALKKKSPYACPHCEKGSCIPVVAYRNVENYGSKSLNVRCVHCNKVINCYLSRVVRLEYVKKSDCNDSDFC
jgi:hypothetical protein